jgi:hypothetical protein
MNPWLHIWTKPRDTIASIVASNPNRSLWLLATIYGFLTLLNLFQTFSFGSMIGALPILFVALIVSPFWGHITFSVWSWVVWKTGKLLKGRGDFLSIRAAFSWSCVPLVLNVFLWLFLVFFFGSALFHDANEGHLLSASQTALLFFVLIAKVVFAIWSLVIYINALAEVQGYSILRAILNIVITWILIGLVLGGLWYLFLLALGVSADHAKTAVYLIEPLKVWR